MSRDELAFWREGARRPDVVEVHFRDTGAGIPEEARERIFVPFYTTKEKGTGLGLAICQRIVKAHLGTIQVRSPPGEGAEFIISLPGLREERPEPEAAQVRGAAEATLDRERRRARAEDRLGAAAAASPDRAAPPRRPPPAGAVRRAPPRAGSVLPPSPWRTSSSSTTR